MDNESGQDITKVVTLPDVVQGKTMAQWEQECWLNVEREKRGEKHVHPTMSNPPTQEEWAAFVQSMTPYETLRAAAKSDNPLSGLVATAALMNIIASLLEDEEGEED